MPWVIRGNKMWAYDAFLKEGELLVARSRAPQLTAASAHGGEFAVWEWRHGTRPHLPGNSFLVSRENPRRIRNDRSGGGSAGGTATELHSAVDDINALLDGDPHDPVELDDHAVLSPVASSDADAETVVLYEFHIVFHAVYQTPVLYFRLCQLDGAPVAFLGDRLRELRLPGGHANGAPLVAMEDHQVLGTPFYLLHPCETASAMALLLQQPASCHTAQHEQSGKDTKAAAPTYLLAWLSLVQPLTHINPLMY